MLPYDPELKARARDLRRNSTIAEILLWKHLQGGQRLGFDFHRQKPILHWIADFFCEQLMLAIEIDGDSHRFRAERDQRKEAGFADLGITTLRFGDSRVRNDLASVIAEIDVWIRTQRQSGETEPK